MLLPAALLLEIDGGQDVGELEHVDGEAPGRPLRGDLRVEGAGLQPDVAGLDLRKVLLERVEQDGDPGLAVVAVVHDLALLLGLGDVGAGLEVEDLGAARLRKSQLRARDCGDLLLIGDVSTVPSPAVA